MTFKILDSGTCVDSSDYRSIAMSLCDSMARKINGRRYDLLEPDGKITYSAFWPIIKYNEDFDKEHNPVIPLDIVRLSKFIALIPALESAEWLYTATIHGKIFATTQPQVYASKRITIDDLQDMQVRWFEFGNIDTIKEFGNFDTIKVAFPHN